MESARRLGWVAHHAFYLVEFWTTNLCALSPSQKWAYLNHAACCPVLVAVILLVHVGDCRGGWAWRINHRFRVGWEWTQSW